MDHVTFIFGRQPFGGQCDLESQRAAARLQEVVDHHKPLHKILVTINTSDSEVHKKIILSDYVPYLVYHGTEGVCPNPW